MNKQGKGKLIRWLGFWFVILIVLAILKFGFGIEFPERYTDNWFNWSWIGILWIVVIVMLINLYHRKKKGTLESGRAKVERDPYIGYPKYLWRIRISGSIFIQIILILMGIFFIITMPQIWYIGAGIIVLDLISILISTKMWKLFT